MTEESRFVLCVEPAEYSVSLGRHKIYRVLPDQFGADHDLVRVVDDTGEDYLYPSSYFVSIEAPAEAAPSFSTPR